jgi:DNA-binding NarL/FixJ family response regulator
VTGPTEVSTAAELVAPVVRVLLVEDQAELAAAMRDLIETSPGVAVIGVCHTLAVAAAVIERLAPDVVVTDFRLPDGDSVDDFAAWKALPCRPRILVVSAWADVRSLRRARLGGAAGYLEKGVAILDLAEVIVAIAGGARRWPIELEADLSDATPDVEVDPAGDALLDRVLVLVGEGCGTREIARAVGCSEAEVRRLVNALLRRHGASSRTELRAAVRGRGAP